MTLDTLSHATLVDVKRGREVLRSECVMAELSMVDRWGKFRLLYRGRHLGSLITRYAGHSSRNV